MRREGGGCGWLFLVVTLWLVGDRARHAQALVRGTMARSSARRNKAAQLRFAKLPAFSFIQAIVDVWEEARLNSEERLVSMFMCVAQGDACLIMMVR